MVADTNSHLHRQFSPADAVYNHDDTINIHKHTSANQSHDRVQFNIQNCKLPHQISGKNANVDFLEPQRVFRAIFSHNSPGNTVQATLNELSKHHRDHLST